MYLLSIIILLLSSCFNLIFGKYLGRTGSILVILFSIFLNLIFCFVIFFEVVLSLIINKLYFFSWINLGIFQSDFCFFFDSITSIMLLVVVFISFFVHLYSIEYMKGDPGFPRFMSYLSLFTFFMLLLVSSDNYLQMFIGWEGVGLSSYLLISFWYTRVLANKAAVKAMLVNKIGDIGLIIAIAIIYITFGSLKYNVVFSLISYFLHIHYIFIFFDFNVITLICIFLFIGAMGKSAQFGLHVWLPDAMEGPTPVSALIHAATMVTAGVFLVIRSCFFFDFSENALTFVAIIGGLTAIFSAVVGAFQFDIKKIVAYSTCSQLGFMFFSRGVSNYSIALFHLFNHAFFKALLFLSMGSILHSICDEQDFRKMGNLLKLSPVIYVFVLIGSVSLLGLPFLTGYFSKDLLLEFTYSRFFLDSLFVYLLGLIAAFFTSFYSTRLIFWIFLSENNLFKVYYNKFHNSGFFMFFSMFILCFCSIFIGYIFNDLFNGIGSSIWNGYIFFQFKNYSIFDAEFDLYIIKYIPVLFSFFGIYMFFYLNHLNFYMNHLNDLNKKNVYFFFNKSWLFDYYYNHLFYNYVIEYSYIYFLKNIERGIFECFSQQFIINIIGNVANNIMKFNTGYIYDYIFNIIFGFVVIWFLLEVIFFFNINIIILFLFGIIIFVTSW